MSHSDPSESSADPIFLVGTDLVQFDRSDLPIYATPASRWAEAGVETVSYGAPLDRLFGEPVRFSSTARRAWPPTSCLRPAKMPWLRAEQPVGRCDATRGDPSSAMHESAAVYDFTADAHVVLHVQDGSPGTRPTPGGLSTTTKPSEAKLGP